MFEQLNFGGVAERLKAAVLKTVRPARVSWVRIPPPPPYRSVGRTSIFTLFRFLSLM